MIALDTETTGLDLNHGCRPFIVTTCDERGENTCWEWDVDPETRRVLVNRDDLTEIQETIDATDRIVLHNSKFDVTALDLLFTDEGLELGWPWERTHDTLYSAHLLASNQPKDLATLSLIYLRKNIKPLERALDKAAKGARVVAKSDYPDWRISTPRTQKSEALPELPSTAGKAWNDLWLPHAVALAEGYYPEDHPWYTIATEYANGDSAATMAIHLVHMKKIKARGLEKIYRERLKTLSVVYKVQRSRITMNSGRTDEIETEYRDESERLNRRCVGLAKSGYDYDLKLPKSGNNNSLKDFVFGGTCDICDGQGYRELTPGGRSKASCPECHGKGHRGNLDLSPLKYSKKTGEPSLDGDLLEHYEATCPTSSKAYHFVKALRAKRQRDTSLSYLESYRRFWLPVFGLDLARRDRFNWYQLFPSLNPTGTNTLRWSSQNPNEQNISKKSIGSHSVRYAFGPLPGREWWSIDASNLELRLPAYEAGEEEMIALFERPDDAPYYGSYHLLVFDTLHPKLFARYGVEVKNRFKSTWYGWTKNGNFAVQYGAVESSGTADRAYHVPGAQKRVQERFAKIAGLSRKMIELANQQGYVETIPDKTVDPDRGYPLLCTRSNSGRILPTVPLSYHVQGTACWWIAKGMVRVQAYLDKLNEGGRGTYSQIMQVHDELVFDFPAGGKIRPKRSGTYRNREVVKDIAGLMEQGGDDLGIPTPVNVTYHPDNWGEGIDVAIAV